jgi:hypothetical protein
MFPAGHIHYNFSQKSRKSNYQGKAAAVADRCASLQQQF